ncbi:MAG: YggS family pyridoxal phosphate-dependent enzyme [Desulfuromonas sp.]|nr:MAG: YggS family pyridoxal phosphate-dependent enzyme [Desulfuromonas sp.]
MLDVAVQLEAIRNQLAQACSRSGRDAQSVRLVAVSKKKPAAMIEQAHAAGQELFGESYVQEMVDKFEEVTAPVCWHFIGGLQSNKVKYLRGKVAMIHSLDRLSLAREIDRQWGKLGERIEVLVQVNLGDEESKSGVAAEQLPGLLEELSHLPHLQVVGLMTLPPYCPDPEDVRIYFRRLRELAEEATARRIPGIEMRELSMGMSHDFEVAIEEGATLIRVGSAIFGERA